MMRETSAIRVGKPDVATTAPAHSAGVPRGNEPSRGDSGIVLYPLFGVGSARRSTGINPRDRDPIKSHSPNLSPA
jgi:hypothetical protein